MTTTPAQRETLLIPVEGIDDSPLQHRSTYDAAKLQELAESIKLYGLLQPIIVRKKELRYELVVGHRRLRATVLAGIDEIAAEVRELDDLQVIEIQLIENVQRVDVSPFDEATAFLALVDDHSYSTELIAEKIGKTPAYVLSRLKLSRLSKDSVREFDKGGLLIGHMIILATLTEDNQTAILDKIMYGSRWDPGKMAHVVDREDRLDQANQSVSELQNFIDRQLLQVSELPFPTDDASLYPDAGPCTTCKFNTGVMFNLFEEAGGDPTKGHCTNNDCARMKANLMVLRKVEEFKDSGKELVLLSQKYEGAPDGYLSSKLWDKDSKGKEVGILAMDHNPASIPSLEIINFKRRKQNDSGKSEQSIHEKARKLMDKARVAAKRDILSLGLTQMEALGGAEQVLRVLLISRMRLVNKANIDRGLLEEFGITAKPKDKADYENQILEMLTGATLEDMAKFSLGILAGDECKEWPDDIRQSELLRFIADTLKIDYTQSLRENLLEIDPNDICGEAGTWKNITDGIKRTKPAGDKPAKAPKKEKPPKEAISTPTPEPEAPAPETPEKPKRGRKTKPSPEIPPSDAEPETPPAESE